ncbi:MAG TPA: hypothetical protein VGK56_11085 [Anaerolineales bacterium]
MKPIEKYSDQELIEGLRLATKREFISPFVLCFEGYYGELQGCAVNMWPNTIHIKDYSVKCRTRNGDRDWRVLSRSHHPRLRKVLELIAFPESLP